MAPIYAFRPCTIRSLWPARGMKRPFFWEAARERVEGPALFNGDDLVLFPVDDQGGNRDLPDLQVISEANGSGDIAEQVQDTPISSTGSGCLRTRSPQSIPLSFLLIVEGNLDRRHPHQGPAHDKETARIAALPQERDKPVKDRMGVNG